MALSSNPLWVQAGKYTASAERVGIFNTLFDRPGKVRKDDLIVSATSPVSMQVSISPGSVVVAPPKTKFTTGYYIATNTDDYKITLPNANVSNTRIDLIVVKVHDSELIANDTDNVTIEIVTGTPAPNPIAPTVPDMCTCIATVRVKANTASISNDDIDNINNIASISNDISTNINIVSSDKEASQVILNRNQYGKPISAKNPEFFYDTRNNQITLYDGTAYKNPSTLELYTGSTREGTMNFSKIPNPIFQAATVVVITNAQGEAVFNFPKPFPNGLITCIAMGGDVDAGSHVVIAQNKYWSKSMAGFVVTTVTTGQRHTNAYVRIEYLAIGW